MNLETLTAILVLPLLLPLGLLVLVKGAQGLRHGRFELYTAAYEGLAGRAAGALAFGLSALLLGFCGILLGRVLGL